MMKYKNYILTLIIVIVASHYLLGQTHIVQGTVINDETNEPVGLVRVALRQTSIQTISDANGHFIMEVPDSIDAYSFEEFSGMNIKEVRFVRKNNYTIYLRNSTFDIFDLSLEELMHMQVISASNISEKLSEVPATMIVISEQDIIERGYYTLSEIFSDLPGMDITRHYGDQPTFNYWRGFRTAFSQPYVFMIDGMPCNDIFYNQPQIMDNLPMSNIEKVEIVYGPVSAVYGANAFMGVINVITKKNSDTKGVLTHTRSRMNAAGDFIGDIYTQYQRGKFRISLAGRFENSDLAKKINLNDNYTDSKLLTDTLLWGNLAKLLNKNGETTLPYSGKSIDLRLEYADSEIGVQMNLIQNGWGLGTPFDKYLPNIQYQREFYYAWFKQAFKLSEMVSTNITLRYSGEKREKGDWIQAYNFTNTTPENILFQEEVIKPQETTRVIDYSIWPLRNEKISFIQRINVQPNEKLLITSGVQFDQTNITKQEGVFGELFTPNTLNENNVTFYPKDEEKVLRATNQYLWKDYSVFSQAKYSFSEKHIVNVGMRLDHNSEYGLSKTIRGGYIFNYNRFTTKVLYGQAYQIPTPRTLFSSATILGSSPNLKPETSETIELNLNYTTKQFSSWLSSYYIKNTNTIVFIGDKSENLGERKVIGFDAYANALVPVSFLKKLNIWAYYSMYLKAEERQFDNDGAKMGFDRIGDLSNFKVFFGATTFLSNKLSFNLRGRYIADRKAVSTNTTSNGEVRVIDGYFTTDANLMYKDLFVPGFSISLKVENIFDNKYYHPGINRANSGTETGVWLDKAWHGSKGWNNSIVPQPHRYCMLSLMFDL